MTMRRYDHSSNHYINEGNSLRNVGAGMRREEFCLGVGELYGVGMGGCLDCVNLAGEYLSLVIMHFQK